MRSSQAYHQSGVAMLVALLVVVIASALVWKAHHGLLTDTQRVASVQLNQQSEQYVSGLETLAGKALAKSNNQQPGVDHNGSVWNQNWPALPIPGGVVTGQLQCLDGRINLNALLTMEGQVDEDYLNLLKRLLNTLGLQETIADALLDWLDADSIASPSGAESQYYQRQQPPYSSLNRALLHVPEIRPVRGITEQVYRQLLPYITALPPQHRKLNANFIQPPVWMALHETIDRQQANQLFQQGLARYTDTDQILQQLQLQASEEVRIGGMLSVNCGYFLARSVIQLGEHQQTWFSYLRRSDNGANTLLRQLGSP